jgi:D-alanyl-D-alanine carboxypeptidase
VTARRCCRRIIAFLAASLCWPVTAWPEGPGADALDALVRAYPDQLIGHDSGSIFRRDGTAMPVSDGVRDKPFTRMLTDASILDQFRLAYPRGAVAVPPAVDDDPGRFRNKAFFQRLYGDCFKGDLAAHLVPVVWLPKSWGQIVLATGVNGVAEKLKAVSAEIDVLPSAVARAAYPLAGIYACRAVADAGQVSMHAFAAAIDLNIAYSDYWLWRKPAANGAIPYRNRMPQEIVDAFERHGFIWGGKWYHYDTMHFEYRPELLEPPARR